MKTYVRTTVCVLLAWCISAFTHVCVGCTGESNSVQKLNELLERYVPVWVFDAFYEANEDMSGAVMLPEPAGYHAFDTYDADTRTQIVELTKGLPVRELLREAVSAKDTKRIIGLTAVVSSLSADIRDLLILLDGLEVLSRDRKTRARYGDRQPFVHVYSNTYNRVLLAACCMYVDIEWPQFKRSDVEEIQAHLQYVLARADALYKECTILSGMLFAIQQQYSLHRTIARMGMEREIRWRGADTWATLADESVVTVGEPNTSYVCERLRECRVVNQPTSRIAVVALDYEVSHWVEPAFVPLRSKVQAGTSMPLHALCEHITACTANAYDIVLTNYNIAGHRVSVIEVGSRQRRERREAGRL